MACRRTSPRFSLDRALAATLWAIAAVVWLDRFTGLTEEPYRSWLVDWHVYAAGARASWRGISIESVDIGLPALERFNHPPAAAIWPIPFLAARCRRGTLWCC